MDKLFDFELSGFMCYCTPYQPFPVMWELPHDELPMCEILVRRLQIGRIVQLSPHPLDIVPNQLSPGTVKLKEGPHVFRGSFVEQSKVSESALP